MRKLIAVLFALLIPGFACAQSVPQAPDLATTVFSASSGNVAAGTATATLAPGPGTTGQLVYICGFAVTSGGQTTGTSVVNLTVTGVQGGTQTYNYGSGTGATVANAPLIVMFPSCIQASNSGVSIVVSLPSLGTGNTNATVNAFGFRR